MKEDDLSCRHIANCDICEGGQYREFPRRTIEFCCNELELSGDFVLTLIDEKYIDGALFKRCECPFCKTVLIVSNDGIKIEKEERR